MSKKINIIILLIVVNLFLLATITLAPTLRDKGLKSSANASCDWVWSDYNFNDIGFQILVYVVCMNGGNSIENSTNKSKTINDTSAFLYTPAPRY